MSKVWEDIEVYVDDAERDALSIRVGERAIQVEPSLAHVPTGLQSLGAHVGVAKDGAADFSVVRLEKPATVAAVYTRNLCASDSVQFSRQNTARGLVQLLCVISKNANVWSPTGRRDLEEIAGALATEFVVRPEHMLLACTGVIGVPLPMHNILPKIPGISAKLTAGGLDAVSQAILTTDKRPKCASLRFGDVVICGYAKGAGMIEPNLATMLVYLYTNARIEKPVLDRVLKRAVDRTFNALSVDSDTSTSDTVALVALGEQALSADELSTFELGLSAVCLKLARAIAREAEGSTKLLEVTVKIGTSQADAMFFAKKIVNSPLMKAAVNGADPNWGRVVMAIGKPTAGSPLLTIDPREVSIEILGQMLYDGGRDIRPDVQGLANAMKLASTVPISVSIGTPAYMATVWGCDLSTEYVIENSAYTT
jgi:glutamate N-acetyltransferase/amino-acid N-acetyltransferase